VELEIGKRQRRIRDIRSGDITDLIVGIGIVYRQRRRVEFGVPHFFDDVRIIQSLTDTQEGLHWERLR
jgi:hypothetical protein